MKCLERETVTPVSFVVLGKELQFPCLWGAGGGPDTCPIGRLLGVKGMMIYTYSHCFFLFPLMEVNFRDKELSRLRFYFKPPGSRIKLRWRLGVPRHVPCARASVPAPEGSRPRPRKSFVCLFVCFKGVPCRALQGAFLAVL